MPFPHSQLNGNNLTRGKGNALRLQSGRHPSWITKRLHHQMHHDFTVYYLARPRYLPCTLPWWLYTSFIWPLSVSSFVCDILPTRDVCHVSCYGTKISPSLSLVEVIFSCLRTKSSTHSVSAVDELRWKPRCVQKILQQPLSYPRGLLQYTISVQKKVQKRKFDCSYTIPRLRMLTSRTRGPWYHRRVLATK